MNTRLAALPSSSATTSSSSRRPKWPPQGKRSIVAGIRLSTVSALGRAPRTVTPCGPANASQASARLPRVADRPHTRRFGWKRRIRASASSNCVPRLLPSSSCHSSTMSTCTPPSTASLSARASIRLRLSGVVTSAGGQALRWRALVAAAVSPVRCSTVQPMPMPSAAACRAKVVSAARARMGVIHSTRGPPTAGVVSARHTASAPNQAASVLPAPVVACSRPLRPAAMWAQTSRWKSKGCQPWAANQPSASPAITLPNEPVRRSAVAFGLARRARALRKAASWVPTWGPGGNALAALTSGPGTSARPVRLKPSAAASCAARAQPGLPAARPRPAPPGRTAGAPGRRTERRPPASSPGRGPG